MTIWGRLVGLGLQGEWGGGGGWCVIGGGGAVGGVGVGGGGGGGGGGCCVGGGGGGGGFFRWRSCLFERGTVGGRGSMIRGRVVRATQDWHGQDARDTGVGPWSGRGGGGD